MTFAVEAEIITYHPRPLILLTSSSDIIGCRGNPLGVLMEKKLKTRMRGKAQPDGRPAVELIETLVLLFVSL